MNEQPQPPKCEYDEASLAEQIKLAEIELAQYETQARSQIDFRRGALYALTQVKEKKAVVQANLPTQPQPGVS